MMGGFDTNEALPVVIGIILAAVPTVLLIRGRRKSEELTPPIAPAGMVTSIREFSGDRAFLFTKDMADATGSFIYRLQLPIPGGAIIIGDPFVQREIQQAADAEKSYLYEMVAKIGGRPSIFTRKSADHLWKLARKGSAPAFSSREVSRMNSVCRSHVQNWIENTVGQEKVLNPSEEMTKLTFLIVMESAFEYSSTVQEYSSFTENLELALREFSFRQSLNPLRQLFGIFLPETRRAVKACIACREFAWNVLKTYRANPNKSPQNTLIKLIDGNAAFDEKLKVSELLTYMVAGFDTTGYTLSSTLVLLAQQPDLVQKARASIKEDGQMTTMIQHILAESNRLYPVAAMGSIRTLPRDMTAFDRASQRKYVIPKGSNCFLPQYLPNRNKTVWGEDADVFRPARWEHATKEMHDARMMFGLGNRNCIGQSLAVAELQSVLPRLIQDYDFELIEKGNLAYFLTLKFQDSKVKLTKV